MKCHELGGTQEWKIRDQEPDNAGYEEKTAIYNMAAGLCLTPQTEKIGMKVEMQVCSENSHLWLMIDVENKITELWIIQPRTYLFRSDCVEIISLKVKYFMD